MTNENDSNTPRTDREWKLPPQRPVSATPPAPTQPPIPNDPKISTKNENETAKELAREFRWVEIAQLAVNGILAVVGIFALIIYHGQLEVMRGQLGEIIKQFPEIQKSAKAARDSAEWSRETLGETVSNFRVGERAWLTPVFARGEQRQVNPAGMAICNLAVENSGKTQAVKVSGAAMVAFIPSGTARLPFESATMIQFNPTVIYQATSHQTYGIPVVRHLDNGRWGGVEWDAILPQVHNRDFLFGYGKISYHDIFADTTHVVTFCEMLIGGFTPSNVGKPTAGFNLRQQCSDYNRAYDEK